MTVPAGLSLHNQTTASDEDFVANFVARHETLDSVLRRLRSAGTNGGDLHQILIGPRGMGKTSLLRRIAIAIDRDVDLAARYIPLTFREEQYNVLTLGDFWRNCGEALAEWAEARGPAGLAGRLDRALANKDWASDDDAAERFQAEITALQRRAVLLVDNLSLILDALSDTDNWTLRRHLQGRRGPIVIGAATQPLRQSADHGAAFYEFFQPVHLEPLDEHETEHCVRALAAARGENGKPVLEVMNRQPERLRTLHTLTGGNPRVLALIYRLLEAGQSDAAMADLDILLDQVTPYYKARVEEYETPQQRAVIDAIALHWDPVTTGGLSGLTNIPTTTLSPLLIRLRRDGLIESVETSGSYAGHQLVERFFNIWYLMRHGTRRIKQKMRWLVAFLTSFYSPRELDEIVRRASDSGLKRAWPEEYAFAFAEALERHRASDIAPSQLVIPSSVVPVAGEVVNGSVTSGEVVDSDLLSEIQILGHRADRLWEQSEYSECIKVLNQILAVLRDAHAPTLLRAVARVLFNKAVANGQLGDNKGEISTYNELLTRFSSSAAPEIREQVAKALLNKVCVLEGIGDYFGAIALCDEVIERYADARDRTSRDQVVKALFTKAINLGKIGHHSNEIVAYDDVITRFAGASDESEIQYVAMSLVNKSLTLGKLGDSEQAIAACDDVIIRFGSARDPLLREQVAKALVNKSLTLGQMGDNTGAIATCEDIVNRFDNSDDLFLQPYVANALVNKAIGLSNVGDSSRSRECFEELNSRFGGADDPAIRVTVAWALFSKAIALAEMGDKAGAIVNYNDAVDRFTHDNDPALRVPIAKVLFNKASMLGSMGDNFSAIAAYDEIVVRFDGAQDGPLVELLAMALVNKAAMLAQMGDYSGALLNCDDVVARFGNTVDAPLREQVAKAIFNKAMILKGMGDYLAAISAFEDVLYLFRDVLGETASPNLALAQIGLANLLFDMQNGTIVAEALYLDSSSVEPLLANANLAWLYLQTARVSAAIGLRSSLVGLLSDSLALLDAGIALTGDNFGSATDYLAPVLGKKRDDSRMDFYDGLDRFLRLAARLDYGERLLAWFEDAGFAEQVAPVYVAFKAYVRGASLLLDVNPEVRRPAQVIYDRLDAPRRFARDGAAKVATTSGKRGRGRRKRGG